MWADGGHAGRLVEWAAEELRLTLQIVRRTDDTSGFVVLPRRWVVERTLSWLMRSRRLARDHETLPAMHETMVPWSMTMLMSGRLAGRRPADFSRTPPRAR
nr:transposase [Streptomyces lunaelactis]